MAVNTNWYALDPKLGFNLANTYTISSTATPEVPQPPAVLGDRINGNLGSEWIFLQASATVSANNLIAFDNNYKAVVLTSALVVSLAYSLGVSQMNVSAAATGDYFWGLLKANSGVAINVHSSVQKNAFVYLSGQAGCITSSATGDVFGQIFVQASIGTSASGPVECAVRTVINPNPLYVSA